MTRTRRTRLGRWGRALAVASLALPAVACTLLTSLDGLTGGGPAGDAGDGAAPSDAPSTSFDSAVADATGADAPSPGDTGADAVSDAGEAGTLLFADNFDDPPSDPADAAALEAPWDQVSSLGAKASRNGAIYVSSPYSMLIQTNSGAQNFDCAGYKSFPAAATTGTYDLGFEIYLEAADTTAGSDAVLAAFELLDAAGTRWALQLEVSEPTGNPTVNFSENGTAADGGMLPFRDHFASLPLSIGTWTKVTMAVHVADADGPASSANTATLSFGSTVVAAAQLEIGTVSGTPQILVGVTYAEPSSPAWTIRYDDVSLTYRAE